MKVNSNYNFLGIDREQEGLFIMLNIPIRYVLNILNKSSIWYIFRWVNFYLPPCNQVKAQATSGQGQRQQRERQGEECEPDPYYSIKLHRREGGGNCCLVGEQEVTVWNEG